MEVFELLESFKRGETVLFLYPPISPSYTLLKKVVEYCKKKGLDLYVADIFDMLYTYKTQLEYIGVELDLNDDRISVIKEGGKIHVGNVLSRISVDEDAAIHLRKYAEVFESSLQDREFVFDVTLGFDKLLAFYSESPKDLNMILMAVKDFVGNKKRTAIYFVNQEVVANIGNALEFLIDSATSVIKLEKDADGWYIRVVKSPKIEIVGAKVKI
ncbi:DUF257 family protein [Thermococcus sp. SY098]|uniref:DUF257 family protein n=1 Tax=Thermococcus sp. SY098 TaxID=3111325 RepID=UPI002D79F278|nr:DUF257 family protein [Thermococcus sp. SY098]WRS53003.1 DUF257 family protein [Thermococcus sp. SY098]